jgi:membrane fusion protein (multidrug efflux system)
MPSSRPRLGPWVAPLCALLLIAGCQKSPPPAPPAAAAVNATVVEVAPRSVPVLVEVVGRTEGSKEVEVRARVSGILERVLYTEGSTTRAGAQLFQIDRAPYEIALAEARAALAQEAARNEQAQREAERLKDLAAKNAISRREADDAASAYKTSAAALRAAEARVRDAELQLSYTVVNAPISGVTGRALRSQGSLVTAGTDSSLLTTLSQTDPLWVRFALSEAEHAVVRRGSEHGRGNEARIVLADGHTHPVTGRVNFAGSTVDTRLGTVQLRAEFPNPDLSLLPGQFVRVQVVAGKQEAILVPQAAVLQGDQGRYVWIVGADGKAAQRPVETGAWLGSDWIILKGLAGGDRVVVDNLLRLRPGIAVEARAAAPAPAPANAAGAAKAAPPAAAPNTK